MFHNWPQESVKVSTISSKVIHALTYRLNAERYDRFDISFSFNDKGCESFIYKRTLNTLVLDYILNVDYNSNNPFLNLPQGLLQTVSGIYDEHDTILQFRLFEL